MNTRDTSLNEYVGFTANLNEKLNKKPSGVIITKKPTTNKLFLRHTLVSIG